MRLAGYEHTASIVAACIGLLAAVPVGTDVPLCFFLLAIASALLAAFIVARRTSLTIER